MCWWNFPDSFFFVFFPGPGFALSRNISTVLLECGGPSFSRGRCASEQASVWVCCGVGKTPREQKIWTVRKPSHAIPEASGQLGLFSSLLLSSHLFFLLSFSLLAFSSPCLFALLLPDSFSFLCCLSHVNVGQKGRPPRRANVEVWSSEWLEVI